MGEFLTWIVLMTCRIGVGSRGELVWGHEGASVSGGGWTRLWTRLTGTVDVEKDDEGTEAGGEGVLRRTITVIMVTTTTMINTGPWGGVAAGHAAVGGVSPHVGGHGGEWYGSGMGNGANHGDGGLGFGPLGDYFVGVPADDQTLQESTPWVSPGMMFSDFLAGDGLDADFGGSHFLDEITAIMQEDDAARRRGQSSGTQAPLDVDLNEPPTTPAADHFALGGTPTSAYIAASHSVAGPSGAPVQPRPPAQPAPDEEEDEIEDKELLIRRGHRTRVPRRCFTGSHLFK
ncbi:uncharacterized protein DS421_20g686280 [Arachis hypogaea]|nr:uncharacterized protein DS421_20g686280 [Arachis hypogaea]